MTRAYAWWALVLVPLGVLFVLGAYWEPIVHDAWGHVRFYVWQRATLADQIHYGYFEHNPRLGQVATLLLYAPGPWHVLASPILGLGLFALLQTLVTGRWPSLRRTDDALLFATIAAIVAACGPIFGQMMFYRPFTGNYVVGLAVQLAFLVPYRVARRGGLPWALPMLVLGAAAGMCNEHTGPAIGAAALVAVIAQWRRGERPRVCAWMIAGLVGLAIGWVALLLAPGQSQRYHELAAQTSTLARIGERGALGDVLVVVKALLYLLLALPWLGLGAWARARVKPAPMPAAQRIAIRAGLAAAVIAAITLIGSPKEGERLAFASCALAGAAIASWVTAQLAAGWSRRVCGALSALALAGVGIACLVTLHEVGAESDARLAAILAAPREATVTVPRFTLGKSRWFVGEDFDDPSERQYVANTYGLAHIELAPATMSR